MADVRELLAESQLEETKLWIHYDDATLVASAIELEVGSNTVKRVTITGIINGMPFDFTMPQGRLNEVINIPAQFRPTGVVKTTRGGTETIDWGFSQGPGLSFSTRQGGGQGLR